MRLVPAALLLLVTALSLTATGFAQGIDEIPLDQLTPDQRLRRRVTREVMVVRAATPAVVFIQSNTERLTRDYWGRVFPTNSTSSGTGVVLDPDGFIVTNYHVVKNATDIKVSFEKSIDDRVYRADLLSWVAEEDLALLKIRDAEGKEFATVPLGTSSDLMIGEPVMAIGNPYGHTHTVSVGIISGLHRGIPIRDPSTGMQLMFDDLIQTDASINPGNSGGPLLNINGELIGINNAVNQVAENIGFAIPIDRVKEVLQQQLISPDRHNAWLGFHIENGDHVEVTDLLPGSPAALAGLKNGDRILRIGDENVDGLDAYRMVRVALRPGEVATLGVERDGESLSIPIRAWGKTDGLIYERLGVQVELVSFGRSGRALRISSLLPEGPGSAIGLQEGDLIRAMRPNGGRSSAGRLRQAYSFRNRIALAQFLDQIDPETEVEIEIRRGGTDYQGTVVVR